MARTAELSRESLQLPFLEAQLHFELADVAQLPSGPALHLAFVDIDADASVRLILAR